MTSYLKWKVRDQIAHTKCPRGIARHCADCRSHDGQTKSEDEWDLIGTPPLHRHCDCTLELVYSDGTTDPQPTPSTPPKGKKAKPTSAQGQNKSRGSIDPKPADETPQYPPGTPSGATPNKPPPAKKPLTTTSGGGNKRR